jgi:hypothetical protein
MPFLSDRVWLESLACATNGIVVGQDLGWIIVQLEAEAGDAVGLVSDQINDCSSIMNTNG